ALGLVGRYAPEQLWYADDVFAIHRGWTLELADEMARRRLRVPFECISRAERIDEDVADALARLGCFGVWIGSEGGARSEGRRGGGGSGPGPRGALRARTALVRGRRVRDPSRLDAGARRRDGAPPAAGALRVHLARGAHRRGRGRRARAAGLLPRLDRIGERVPARARRHAAARARGAGPGGHAAPA